MNFVEAEAGIRQLHARYVDAVWRKDFAALEACFTPDCEWRIAGEIVRGPAGSVAFLKRMLVNTRRLLVTLRTPILHVEGNTASARTYFTAQNALNDGPAFTPIGMYYERFVFQEDRWRFTWRLFQTHYAGPPDLSGTFFDLPDFGPPPNMPPLDAMADKSPFVLALEKAAVSSS